MDDVLLRVEQLDVAYGSEEGLRHAVRKACLTLRRGQTLGVVGESGCGKSTLVRGLLRLLPPPAVILGGEVLLDGEDLLSRDGESLRRLRWRDVAIVPQSALNSLNPLLTIGQHFAETFQAHTRMSQVEVISRAGELMAMVGLEPEHLRRYPHELSGGMRQRAVIALALALSPKLLVMDEPTTALDVVVERELISRVMELQRALGFGMLFVTHDLPLLLQFATDIAVMYAGRVVEVSSVESLRRDGGAHPYTRALLGAIPGVTEASPRSIPGGMPGLVDPPAGCRFHPRCSLAVSSCREGREPVLRDVGEARVACTEVS